MPALAWSRRSPITQFNNEVACWTPITVVVSRRSGIATARSWIYWFEKTPTQGIWWRIRVETSNAHPNVAKTLLLTRIMYQLRVPHTALHFKQAMNAGTDVHTEWAKQRTMIV